MPNIADLTPEQLAEVHRKMDIELALNQAAQKLCRVRWIPHQPTRFQAAFLALTETEAFYGGAGGGGKSDALLMGALEHVDEPKYAAIIFRRTYAELSKPGALIERAQQWLRKTPAKWNEQKKQWRFPSGALLQFGHMENETDKYNYLSDEYQYIGFDELTEFSESQYRYLFSRLRRLAGAHIPLRVRSGSNPGGPGAVWVKQRFIPDEFVPSESPDPRVLHKTYVDAETKEERLTTFVPARLEDNPHIDQKSYIGALSYLDAVTLAQILKGDWLISPTGRLRFDINAIARFQAIDPTLGELFEHEDQFGHHIRFEVRSNGLLALWKRPMQGRCYVMGIDAASGKDANRGEGVPDPDWCVTQVRDLDSGEQVARLRGRVREQVFGDYNFLLGKWYNWAYCVVGVTGGYGRGSLDRMIERGYPYGQMYCRRDESKLATPQDYEYLGFEETTVSRPKLYHWLDMAIMDHSIETFDAVTLNEYRTFEIDKDGIPRARAGCKDDCVSSDAFTVVGIRRAPRRKGLHEVPKGSPSVARYGPWAVKDEKERAWKEKWARM